MNFTIDKQTLDDLNLLGKYKQHSVFSLFNKVVTPGGEKLLSEMFQHPLTDVAEINKRSSIFKYFQSKALTLPFSNEQFAAIETFTGGSSGGNYLTVLAGLFQKKILAAMVRDEAYAVVQTGLRQTVETLISCNNFMANFTDKDNDSPYFDQLLAIKNFLADERLNWLKDEQNTRQWPLLKLAKYDHLLRNTLRAEMDGLIHTLHEIDVYIAVANLATAKGFCYAEALPAGQNVFTATNLRHPAMEKAIGNTVSMRQESNLIFLTGANMAGKSTFMKTFGVSVYLAHMGFPVAATAMQFSVRDGIWSSINVPDNLNKGLSHFYAEVLRVKTVAKEVSRLKNLVVIFDELFKGTNVKDAYDATLAVTAAFAEYKNSLFIISTHIVEAGEALRQQRENIRFLYLPTIMHGKVPTYTYQLQYGISADRHGMMIIENEGILNMLETDKE